MQNMLWSRDRLVEYDLFKTRVRVIVMVTFGVVVRDIWLGLWFR